MLVLSRQVILAVPGIIQFEASLSCPETLFIGLPWEKEVWKIWSKGAKARSYYEDPLNWWKPNHINFSGLTIKYFFNIINANLFQFLFWYLFYSCLAMVFQALLCITNIPKLLLLSKIAQFWQHSRKFKNY